MTPKQILVAHVRARHPTLAQRPSFERINLRGIITAHRYAHHHYTCDHTHGPTGGANDRPIGWTTGQDVKMR
jgi:hypothetical protein